MMRIKGAYRPNYRARKCYWDKSMKMSDYCDIKSVALLPESEVNKIKSLGRNDYQDYLEICEQYSAIEAARMMYDTLGM